MWCIILLVLYGITLPRNVYSETISPSNDALLESKGEEVMCPPIQSKSGNRTLKWRATPVGKIVIPEEPCLDDSEEYITRECQFSLGRITWSTPSSHCSNDYASSNVTEDLYEYYKRIYYGIEIDATYVEMFFKRFNEFEAIDYTILFDCLHDMPTETVRDDLTILVNMMSSLENTNKLNLADDIGDTVWERLNGHMKNMSHPQNNVTIITPNVVISAWKPFLSNITGIALYNYTTKDYTRSSIVYIYANQTSRSIDRTNLEIAAYIPYEFLEQLIDDSVNKITEVNESLYVIMSLIKNDTYIGWDLYTVRNVTDIVSVSIPEFCKKNSETYVKVFFKDSGARDWIDFGTEYIDSSSEPSYTCVLSQLSNFAYTYTSPKIEKYFESAKQDYCMRSTLIVDNTSEITVGQTETGKIIYPENFCIGAKAKIPKAMCLPTGKFVLLSMDESHCVNDHPVSNFTYQLYESATACWNIDETQAIINYSNHTDMTAVDKMLLFSIIWCLAEYKIYNNRNDKSINFIANIYDEAYGFLDEIPKRFIDVAYLSYPLAFYHFLINYKYPDLYLLIKPNLIHFITAPFVQNITGLALYKKDNGTSLLSYEVRYLTPQNTSEDRLIKDSAELVAFIPPNALNEIGKDLTTDEKNKVCVVVTILCSYKFLEVDHKVESHVVGIRHLSEKSTVIKINVFMRTLGANYGRNEGYWSAIKSEPQVMTLAFVSANDEDKCEGIDKVTTLQISDLRNYKLVRRKIKKPKGVDIISQVSMSINYAKIKSNLEEMYHQHASIFKALMFIGGCLSCFGILGIFTSALLLKHWHKKRFYTLQLSIVLACEIMYFITDTSSISAVGYIFFYYCILAQFTWMTMIGYIQYIKFIQIFQTSLLNTWKSLALGWLTPAVITLLSVIIYKDCFSCNLCVKNSKIFMYFVITPVCLVIVANLTIYVFVLINISKSDIQEHSVNARSSRNKAIFLLAFMLGISWIFIFALISPWWWLTLAGCYLFHIIAPSQGFILFIFVVVLDQNTRNEWEIFYNVRIRVVEGLSFSFTK